jgi:polyferredoxin
MATVLTHPDGTAAAPAKKKLVRRSDRDYSQRLRLVSQLSFLLLNVWIGVQFFFWVRFYESGGGANATSRPAGVEGWLPIAGLMNLKYLLVTGSMPAIHPASLVLLASFLAISLLLRKAFCSWLCPVGTVSEYLWKLGRKILKRNFQLPRWADLGLRSLKYLLLGFFGWAVVNMSAVDIDAFQRSTYGLIVDVRMLNFFRFLGTTAAVVIGILMILSLFVQNLWCRYLCPYGALLGMVLLGSPAKIKRYADPCIDCGKCAKACPSALAVDKLVTIRSVECTGCLECVAVCPAKDALQFELPRKTRVPAWAVAATIAIIFFGGVAAAKLTNHWDTRVPDYVLYQLVPAANEQSHP